MMRVAIVASTSGTHSTIDVPLVHLTPARATLSLRATVRPSSALLFGAVHLAVTWRHMSAIYDGVIPMPLMTQRLVMAYLSCPGAKLVILGDMDVCSRILLQVWPWLDWPVIWQ